MYSQVDSISEILVNDQINTLTKLNELNDIAWKNRFKQPQHSIHVANASIKLNSGIHSLELGKSLYTKADAYRKLQNVEFAIINYLNAILLLKKTKTLEGLSGCYNNLALVYDQSGNYDNALKYYLLSLKVNQQLDKPTWIAVSLNNIGTLHQEFGNFQKSLKYAKESLDLKLKHGSQISIAHSYNNLGEIYTLLNNFEKAEFYFKKALIIKKVKGTPKDIASTYNNIGKLFEANKQFNDAIKYYQQSLALQESVNDNFGAATSLLNIGSIYLKDNQTNKAIDYLRRCVDISESTSAFKELKNAYKALSTCYELLNDKERALRYHKLYTKTQDKIINIETNKTISELDARYQSEKKIQQLAFLQKENDLQVKSIKNKRFYNYFISTILLIVIVLTILLAITNSKRKKINTLLKEKYLSEVKQKEEKEVLLKEIHHRVKNNLQIVISLLRLQSHQISDKKILGLFEECQHRISSMSLIHEKLYRTEDLAQINIEEYVNELTKGLVKSYATTVDVSLKINTSVTTLGIDSIIPFGLIINEIISNSLKYGFKDKTEGIISIDLSKKEDTYTLKIGDNGVGIAPEAFNNNDNETLGIELIKSLASQIEGTINLLDLKGTYYSLKFKDV